MNPTRRSNPERILLEPIQDRHNQNQDRHNQNQDRHNQDRHNQDRHIRSQLFGTTLPGDGLPRLRTLGGQWSRVVVLAMAGMGFNAAPMQAREIGFVEDFALAADREKALSSLIPGTADYYYYHCLHDQAQGNTKAYKEFLDRFVRNHGRTQQVIELENRQSLLDYAEDPAGSLNLLQNRVSPRLDHQRETQKRSRTFPSRLDDRLISRQALLRSNLFNSWDLGRLKDQALRTVNLASLDEAGRRSLLSRIQDPDFPNLMGLIEQDLRNTRTGGFGSMTIHGRLTLSQLEALAKRIPDLNSQDMFVREILTRLREPDAIRQGADRKVRERYLNRLLAFTSGLDPAMSSLKALVLYHILEIGEKTGTYDRERMIEYLKIPRTANYLSPMLQRNNQTSRHMANLNVSYVNETGLPPIGNDEPLVSRYLEHFLIQDENSSKFTQFFEKNFLQRQLAQARILTGVGDPESWASGLSPEEFRTLKNRIEIEFAPTNPEVFGVDDLVRLDVDVKNVKTLIIKVFEINAFNYFQEKGTEVDLAINLDGLVSSHEEILTNDMPPFQRVRKTFTFPSISGPGVYVVELIGNGQSSRALIHKGRLDVVDVPSPAGHQFIVLNEHRVPVTDATIWMGGREYQPETDGAILIPFTTSPGRENLIVRRGVQASLVNFEHQSESYQLQAGFHVERENLIQDAQARVIVRPVLTLHDRPVGLDLLDEPRLTVAATDADGTTSQQVFEKLEFVDGQDHVAAFKVPDRLRRLSFTLSARIKNVSLGREETLQASGQFELNQIDSTNRVEDLHLARSTDGYVIHLVGRNGEPIPGALIDVELRPRDFTTSQNASLETDTQGRCFLGTLGEIESIGCRTRTGASRDFTLSRPRIHYPSTLIARAGETILLPFPFGTEPGSVALFELRNGKPLQDLNTVIKLMPGTLRIEELRSGHYELQIRPSGTRIALTVADGLRAFGQILAEDSILESRSASLVRVENIIPEPFGITLKLAGFGPSTRVHVFSSRFMPAFKSFENLRKPETPRITSEYARALSFYESGRNIGDEHRYILDRRMNPKYLGSMLEKPGLVLNPWSLRKSETEVQAPEDGSYYGSKMSQLASRSGAGGGAGGGGGISAGHDPANLDFLDSPGVALPNLRPDPGGTVHIGRNEMLPATRVLVVDEDTMFELDLDLGADSVKTRDLRLERGLDPATHQGIQKLSTSLGPNGTLTIEDRRTAQLEAYTSLKSVFDLMSTLNEDSRFKEFEFLVGWDELKPEKRLDLYAKYACHEVDLFLDHHDPEFFASVIKPYLENKKEKSFLDYWLLERPLGRFTTPFLYARLNVVERILLARRLNTGTEAVRRARDEMKLLPPNHEHWESLFETALRTQSLSVGGSLTESARELANDFDAKSLSFEGFDDAMESAPMERSAGRANRKPAPPSVAMSGVGMLYDAQEADEEQPFAKNQEMFRSKKDAFEGKSKELMKAMTGRRGRSEARESMRRLFRKLDTTEELVESHYDQLLLAETTPDLVTVNGFWMDFATHRPGSPFLSNRFPEATRNRHEMLLALAVLDLPMKSTPPTIVPGASDLKLSTATGGIVFHEEVRESGQTDRTARVLISQDYFRQSDRYELINGERRDKYVTDEFIKGIVYGCQVILTNPGSSTLVLDALLQVPTGSFPLGGAQYTDSTKVHLSPYETRKLEYTFYFPKSGVYPHYPVQVSREGLRLGWATETTLKVVDEPTVIDQSTWDWISQNGSPDQVMGFLETANLFEVDMEKIAFRMKDRGFFTKTLDFLRRFQIYSPTLWAYGFMHKDESALKEFLETSSLATQVGDHLVSRLLTVDPIVRRIYDHRDYAPLVNARSHRLGKTHQILNNRLLEQYSKLLKVLTYKNSLDDNDHLSVAHYLLLQGRMQESLEHFDAIDRSKIEAKLPYDYLSTYLALITQDLDRAREIVARYESHPIRRWRERFKSAADQLAQVEDETRPELDRTEDASQDSLAETATSLDLDIRDKLIRLTYQNAGQCQLNFYPMDIELLFSRNPFVKDQSTQFSFIQPAHKMSIPLTGDQPVHKLPIPVEFENQNVMIEAIANGVRRSKAYFANSLSVQVIEEYGQIRVAHLSGVRPIPVIYVKVYARMKDGRVVFYKDGYTDVRNRFDFASLNTNEIDEVERFSILVLSEELGAVIREADPPKR